MTPKGKAWNIWVDYCGKVKAWYAEGQKEPWGMNPPTEQIVDATITQDSAYREAEGIVKRVNDTEGIWRAMTNSMTTDGDSTLAVRAVQAFLKGRGEDGMRTM